MEKDIPATTDSNHHVLNSHKTKDSDSHLTQDSNENLLTTDEISARPQLHDTYGLVELLGDTSDGLIEIICRLFARAFDNVFDLKKAAHM